MCRVMTVSRLSKKSEAASRRAASSLRSRTSTASSEVDDDVDVESQRLLDGDSKKTDRRRSAADAALGPAAPNSPAASSASRVRITMRKIAEAILTNVDDETLVRDDTETVVIIITLLKEAMVGVIAAFLVVSLCLLVDHIFTLRLPTARAYRKATFAVMNDRETLRSFEENSGLKFVSVEEYDDMTHKELENTAKKKKKMKEIIKQRTEELIRISAEKEEFAPKYYSVLAKSGVDKFNPNGIYHGFKQHSCQWRVDYMIRTQEVPKFDALFKVMKRQSCVKTKAQIEETRKVKEVVDAVGAIARKWDFKYGEGFDADGEWDEGTSCSDRADFLSKNFGYRIVKARALCMVETGRCRKSVNAEKEGASKKLFGQFDPFCGECIWDPENEDNKTLMTCGGRVRHLMGKDGLAEREARLKVVADMRSCVRAL